MKLRLPRGMIRPSIVEQRLDMAIFGDGTDGDVVVSAVVTLTRDMFYSNLTVIAGGEVKANGFRIYVRNKLKTKGGGKVTANGNDATTTNLGADATATGTLLGGSAGGNGADINPGDGTTGGNQTNSLGGAGGVGGGDGLGDLGTAGGTVTAPAAALGSVHSFDSRTLGHIFGISGGLSRWTPLTGGAGGGGGFCTVGQGPGGGSGGGILVICARELDLERADDLQAHGGKGHDGSAGRSGGGGGGGGGLVIITYAKKTRPVTFSAAVNAAGGTGGAGLLAVPPGVAGANGANGTLVEFELADVVDVAA